MEANRSLIPLSISTPTDSFDATALFTTMLCQAASMPSSAASTTGPSLQQIQATTHQHIPSTVASSSGHADQHMPTTSRISTTCNTENLSQQTTGQHNKLKHVSTYYHCRGYSQFSQHGTTAGQSMQTSSVTRPRIRHLPPIYEHDIIILESDIVSAPAELVDYTSLYIEISPETSFNSTHVTISPVLHSSPDSC
ncbi:unnamed protein product [Mytilus coruscus]|uniref:Uncharacterized protein n=1 Tax=Mytilus coruscus TaxID=42192 RepID=A0A6J8BGS4_MYTCO|nr:unnamed protein product [Mytilus coruscus]